MAVQIQLRRDTATNWTNNNPTLAEAELGIETDTDKIKVGDGTTAWTSLAYGAFTLEAHNTTHQSGGADVIKIDDLAAGDDNTDLNASTTKHGLMPKGTGTSNHYFKSDNSQGALHSASASLAGAVELATTTETTTGTDTGRAVTPDGLAGSAYGKRVIQVLVTDPGGDAITTGDGKAYFFIPSDLNGYNLVDADACVTTASTSGTPTIQIYNVTDSVDMLSTRITIDANEKTSYTAATAPVIDTSNDDVATGDELRVDIDVAGTGAKGLTVILVFQLP